MQFPQAVDSFDEFANHHFIHLSTQIQLLNHALIWVDSRRLEELLREEPRLNQVIGEMLWHAVMNDQRDIAAALLVKAGADPKARKMFEERRSTILHELVKKGDKKYDHLTIFAMRHGADVRARDEDGLTPLDHAVRKKCSIVVIRELADRAECVNGRASVSLVVEAADHPDAVEAVAALISRFPRERAMEQRVDDTLRYCLSEMLHETRVLPAVKILVDMKLKYREGVIRETRSNRGIVLEAIRNNKVEIAQLLLERGYHTIHLLSDIPEYMTAFANPLTDVHEAVIKYLTLTIIKGKAIDDCNLKIIRRNPEMHTYHTQCLDELKKMKAMKITNNISFFSILECAKEIPFLTRNATIFEKSKDAERKGEFPIYRQEMDVALKSATIRKHLLTEREEAISESLENILPFIPVERIIYYFYLNEIK